MSLSLTYNFKNSAEVVAFLAKVDGQPTAVAAAPAVATIAAPVVAENKAVEKQTKGELTALCASKGLVTSASMTKAQLIDLLAGGAAAPVVAEVAPVPAAVLEPIAEVAPVVAAPVAVDSAALIEQFKTTYNTAKQKGVDEGALAAAVNGQLAAVGHPAAKIGALPPEALSAFVQSFGNQTTMLVNALAPAAADSGSFL